MIATNLEAAQKQVARLWILMCKEEGIPTNSKFVVFNSTNKYANLYNKAVKNFFQIRNSLEAR